MMGNRITDAMLSELVSESHPGCRMKAPTPEYCDDPIHARAREIRHLTYQQRADDRSFVQHASDGRTATQRIGSIWVSYMSSEVESKLLWPEPDPVQLELASAIDVFLETLTEEERDLVLLRFQHLVPLRTLGDEIGASKDTVSRMITETLCKLKISIQEVIFGGYGVEKLTYKQARSILIEMVEEYTA
jgi:DNA-directed RNA polymerase sigma subunit (sigma70/sigma32)